jgi:RNase H-fold protein (predicted Holliday junction resolvase)
MLKKSKARRLEHFDGKNNKKKGQKKQYSLTMILTLFYHENAD